MKIIEFRANERGYASHGWLEANHYFSFGGWYNPDKINFGALRVVNDDEIAPGKGFGTHPHDNMEIITIPLSGELEHKDSMGNGSVISSGEIQVMSAGTGIQHSEFNPSENMPVKLFQIWILPKYKNINPEYNQLKIEDHPEKNTVYYAVGPKGGEELLQINQDAWISFLDLDAGKETRYNLKSEENGVFVIQLNGNSEISEKEMEEKDALGIYETVHFDIKAKENSDFIFIEVPMEF